MNTRFRDCMVNSEEWPDAEMFEYRRFKFMDYNKKIREEVIVAIDLEYGDALIALPRFDGTIGYNSKTQQVRFIAPLTMIGN